MEEVPGLSKAVARALKRWSKWCPPTMEPEDFAQEAWVGVLEAVRDGVRDESEIVRLAELHLQSVVRAERERREVPVGLLFGQASDDNTEDEALGKK